MSDLISRQAVRFIESEPDAYPQEWNEDYEKGFCDAINAVLALPSAEPEQKGLIQKFHDYQVDWLKGHFDLEFESQLEELIIRFLHDTTNCFLIEMDRDKHGE